MVFQPRSQGPKTIFTGEIYPRLPGVGKPQVPKTDGAIQKENEANTREIKGVFVQKD